MENNSKLRDIRKSLPDGFAMCIYAEAGKIKEAKFSDDGPARKRTKTTNNNETDADEDGAIF